MPLIVVCCFIHKYNNNPASLLLRLLFLSVAHIRGCHSRSIISNFSYSPYSYLTLQSLACPLLRHPWISSLVFLFSFYLAAPKAQHPFTNILYIPSLHMSIPPKSSFLLYFAMYCLLNGCEGKSKRIWAFQWLNLCMVVHLPFRVSLWFLVLRPGRILWIYYRISGPWCARFAQWPFSYAN